jgi:hypothetical protein
MSGIMDEEGNYLSPDQILVLSETVEGRAKVKRYILMARTAYSVQEMLNYLQNELNIFSRALSPTEQQNLCNVLFYCFFQLEQEAVCQYVEEVHKHFQDEDIATLNVEYANA